MLLRSCLPAGWAAAIRAVDVDAAALARASAGVYSEWALRETPDAARSRWFVREGQGLVLRDEVKRAVEFEERNLAEAEPGLWLPGTYDVILCRNVLMYFTPRKARELSERIAAALAPGGYLFLGHAETLRGLSSAFKLLHTHDSFYYQLREGLAATVGEPYATSDAVTPGPVSLVPHVEAAGSWVEAIARASERIRELDTSGSSPPVAASRAPWDLGLALELLRAERFGDALDLLSRLPADARGDTGVLLLRATLLAHSGALAEAEVTCLELLESDDCSAEAHYLLALCREGRGDLAGAHHHDQLAAHLDPAFAMPRLHRGLMSRRAGRGAAAGQELAEALDLLRGEEPSRLLLFGGGFNRAALEALCAAELAACGGGA
jgi:chemotaxis protein methyltransferase CheR